jgi:1-phosphofructokinase family hexose kinase
MIVTVTPNPALDATYTVDQLVPGESISVRSVHERAGGKGVNVASVLHAMGYAVTAVLPLGGPVGELVRDDLATRGIDHRVVPVGGATRRCVAVVDADGSPTVLNEPGPNLTEAECARLLDAVSDTVEHTGARVIVASGSLPPGVSEDFFARLVAIAHRHGARVVVDASGAPLRAALDAGPDLVKPNRAEATTVTALDDPTDSARALVELGAGVAVVSDGSRGLTLATGAELMTAVLDPPAAGNPTGAGDALAAALAAALSDGPVPGDPQGWPARLTAAVAWSAAAVRQPYAGIVSADDVSELRSRVQINISPYELPRGNP